MNLGKVSLEKLWDWNVNVGYRYVQSDATVDGFADSDFGGYINGTNLKGYTVGGQPRVLAVRLGRPALDECRYHRRPDAQGRHASIRHQREILNMNRTLFSLLLLLAAPVLGSGALYADDAAVLAHVGPDEIKTDTIRPFFSNLDSQQQAALAGNPKLLDQTVESILVQQLIYKRAVAEKWDQQPDAAAQLERAREKAISEGFLASVTKPPADYPSEAEVKSAYEANKSKLVVPRQFRLAQIYIAVPESLSPTPATAQARLDAVVSSLGQPGADFAVVARSSSDDKASAARGGELGWVAESQVQPELRSRVLALGKGAVSSPIKLADGWHILKGDRPQGIVHRFARGSSRPVGAETSGPKSQLLQQAYLAKLVQENPISLNSLALSQLLIKPDSK